MLIGTLAYGQSATLAPPAAPFVYQGKLTLANGDPATGNFDMIVQIYGTETGGTPLATINLNSVSMANGIFTIPIEVPGDLFSSVPSTYLDMQVSPAGANSYTQLSPRLAISSTPYALALNCVGCVSSQQIVSVDGAKVTGTVANASNAATATSATSAYSVTGIVGIANGGTGSNVKNFVDLSTAQSIAGDKSFTGVLSGNGSGLVNVPGTLKWNVVASGNVQAQPNNGYVLTNGTASTVTLPATPAVGDVVRVIEKGTGGFTLAMNSGQSIMDWATSHLETIWTRQYNYNSSGSTIGWSGIASSNDGMKLAAVEYQGRLVVSSNGGQGWMDPMPDDPRSYTSIASSSDGTKLIAAVENGYLYTSTDSGATWTPRFADSNRYWYSVASSADGTKLIAADITNVYTSTNGGASWTARRSTGGHVGYVASSADGTKLIVAENSGHVYTSTDSGATWTDRLSSSPNQWSSVASSADGSKLVATENPGRIWISANSGVTWTPNTVGPAGTNTKWTRASMSSDGLRIAASANNPSGLVAISYDGGTSWTPTGVGTSWTAVAVAGNGGSVAAGAFDSSANKLYTGAVTTQTVVDTITGVKDSAVELVYIGSNQFVMVSSNNMTIPPHTYRNSTTSR
ncbi:MAG: hypothetical protein DCC44_11810 [Acidobacteria bacterium]|nr:MAG: hypothetical protein DCC44_11810 [Acidobacteriota bacterium]